jgi:BirA family biotin operon repressor/biotin-[acetyl-CoA-carboxylase] ligase
MLALGLAARDAIAEASGLDPDLRWPNDVLLHEKKCAGVMAQLELGKIVAGIGINVGQTHFPPEIGALATSLRLEGARNVAREQLLATLVHNVDYFVAMSSRTLIELFSRASSYIIGRRVCVDLDGRSIIGMTQGLDASGFLVVREDNGKETTILAGGVRPA